VSFKGTFTDDVTSSDKHGVEYKAKTRGKGSTSANVIVHVKYTTKGCHESAKRTYKRSWARINEVERVSLGIF
jgi:hypothetical protein